MTLSKSGVSVSTGIPGFRVTMGPRGSYVTVGARGISYRQRIGNSGRIYTPASPGTSSPMPVAPPDTTPLQILATADVADLVDVSSAQTLDQLNRYVTKLAYAPIALVCGFVLSFLLSHLSLWIFFVGGALTLIATYVLHQSDVVRRTFPLFYVLDQAAANDWQELVNGLAHLAHSQRIWRVDAQADVLDRKRNAGASQVVRRQPVHIQTELPPFIQSNLVPYCLNIGAQRLYFFPDRIYVHQNGRYGCVDYSALSLGWDQTSFIEETGVPRDAQIVGHTWRYVNKDGSPDRRFNNNHQLPIALYGEVTLQSQQGLFILLQISNCQAARNATEPFQRGVSRFHSHYTRGAAPPAAGALALAGTTPRPGPQIPRFGAWAAALYALIACAVVPTELSRPAPQHPPMTTASSPAAPPNAAPGNALQISQTAQLSDQPPPHLTKAQRAQWWVARNREMRRRARAAQDAREVELRNTRAYLEALDFQRRQNEKAAQARARQAASQSAPEDLPPPTLLPSQVVPSEPAYGAAQSAPLPAAGGFGEGGVDPSIPGVNDYSSAPVSTGLGGASSDTISVRGYYRKDGTYVRPHTRRRHR